jgi:hypothetical protein
MFVCGWVGIGLAMLFNKEEEGEIKIDHALLDDGQSNQGIGRGKLGKHRTQDENLVVTVTTIRCRWCTSCCTFNKASAVKQLWQ